MFIAFSRVTLNKIAFSLRFSRALNFSYYAWRLYGIIFLCSGGVGRTGVFCGISMMIERLKAEGVIDVFQTVQAMRLQRPAMVQTAVSRLDVRFKYSRANPHGLGAEAVIINSKINK